MHKQCLSGKVSSLGVFLIALSALTARSHAQSYSIQDLGSLGGSSTIAHGINSLGQMTGFSNLAHDTASHAFLYQNGTMTDLGTLGGQTSIGNSINASGQVAGYSTRADGSYRAFLNTGGTMTALPTLGGNYESTARGMGLIRLEKSWVSPTPATTWQLVSFIATAQ